MTQSQYLDRPPRVQPLLPQERIEIPPPPEPKQDTGQSLIEVFLPGVTIIGYLLMSLTGVGRSLVLMLPMGMAMFASVFVALRRRGEAGKENEAQKMAYRQRLADLQNELRRYHEQQRDFYYYNYPPPTVTASIATGKDRGRNGSRIWERRTTDADFSAIRIGAGSRPSTVVFTFNQARENTPLADEAMRLVRASQWLADAPITVQLRQAGEEDAAARPTRHSLGIFLSQRARQNRTSRPATDITKQYEPLYDYVRALLIHYATFHSPQDTKLYVIGSKANKSRWEWTRGLPHSRAGQKRNEDLLCFDDEEVRGLDTEYIPRMPLYLKDLLITLQTRQQRLSDKELVDVTLPFLLVVIDTIGAAGDMLENIQTDSAISMILRSGKTLGAAVIFLGRSSSKIPSDVQTMIELEDIGREVVFRYSETGVNTARIIGQADFFPSTTEAEQIASSLNQYEMRLSAAASLASAIDLLQLNGVNDVSTLSILENWEKSRQPEKAEWPHVPIGAKSAAEFRSLTFAAHADGIHGMIAGTTGSGKSELLLTLIVGLAINYDPTIINFLLVDFKGGAAFDEFRTLPHCVDIVTNLSGNAVDRMFSAIKAELDRRGEMIAKYNVKHIVDYRRLGYHLVDQPQKHKKYPNQDFPHLFIIIDEFAEMVAENPEYKAQLDSITRLGRAIGVSLVLATQRPAGMITDQMRANMKFKICLRVETPDDSRELLRRNDAAYLPTSIPGRAYIQIGNELPELIQVARAGGEYRMGQTSEQRRVRWLDRKRAAQDEGKEAPPLSKVIVDQMERMQKDDANHIRRLSKPWPNPLPKYLPLADPLNPDIVQYFDRENRLVLGQGALPQDGLYYLSKPASQWQAGEGKWPMPFNWASSYALTANVGLIDHPRQARQLVYTIDLKRTNVAAFSSSGWGKSTFLRTLIMALVVQHPPNVLHLYLLDFGGRSLSVFGKLPHVGTIIKPDEKDADELVNRLVRYLNQVTSERQKKISDAQAGDIIGYNQMPGHDALPAILVVIDNFAELKENYEDLLPDFIALMREGRAVGVYFVASADAPGSMSNKVFNQFTERVVFTMIDKSEYPNIVGRSGTAFGEIPGRGLVKVERELSLFPLELQIASPVALNQDDIENITAKSEGEQQDAPVREDEKLLRLSQVMTERLQLLSETMARGWKGEKAPAMEVLPPFIHLPELVDKVRNQLPSNKYAVVLGKRDDRLEPFILPLETHFIIVGPPLSGRTYMLRSWIMTIAKLYRPEEVNMVLIDFQKRLIRYGGKYNIGDLPQVLTVISEPEDVSNFVSKMEYEYRSDRDLERYPLPELFVFIDNYDDFVDLIPAKDDLKRLGQLARQQRDRGLHFVLCGSPSVVRSNEELRKQVGQSRFGFALRTTDAVEALGGKMPRSLKDVELPVGRGFLIDTGRTSLAQIGTMEPASASGRTYIDVMDDIIEKDQGEIRYRWYIEINPPPQTETSDVAPQTADASALFAFPSADGTGSLVTAASRGSNGASPAARDERAATDKVVADDIQARAEKNRANPYFQRGLLVAANIRKLEPGFVQSLKFEQWGANLTAEELIRQPTELLQDWMDKGTLMLPETLTDEQVQAVEAAVAAYDAQHTTTSDAPNAMRDERALQARANQNKKNPLYPYLTGVNLRKLAPMHFDEFKLKPPNDLSIDQLMQSSAEDIQTLIDSGRMMLPPRPSPEVVEKVRQIVT